MRKTILLPIVIGLACSAGNLFAQTLIKPHANNWGECNCKVEFSGDSLHMINTSGATAILWIKEGGFVNGTIEFDVKGKDVRGESFVGVAFHATDVKSYHAVYFRPFNFRDPKKKDRAVQYVQLPENDWDVLRERTPGKYEHRIVPDIDPNAWFHVKITINYPRIEVFVNGSREATLSVDQLDKKKDGHLGLWIDGAEGWFKNVVLTNRK